MKKCPECKNRMYGRTNICEICGFEVIPIKKEKKKKIKPISTPKYEIPIFPEPEKKIEKPKEPIDPNAPPPVSSSAGFMSNALKEDDDQ